MTKKYKDDSVCSVCMKSVYIVGLLLSLAIVGGVIRFMCGEMWSVFDIIYTAVSAILLVVFSVMLSVEIKEYRKRGEVNFKWYPHKVSLLSGNIA